MQDSFKPFLPRGLSQQKKNVLELIIFLKEKLDGTTKDRNYAGGGKKNKFTKIYEAEIPTARLE